MKFEPNTLNVDNPDFNAEKTVLKSRCLTRTSDNSKYSSGPIDFELTSFNHRMNHHL